MISDELRDMVIRYIDDQASLADLETWIVPRLPALISNPRSPDADLVAAVELALAELSRGIRSEPEVRSLIRKALQENISVWTDYPAQMGRSSASGSANETANIAHWSRSIEFSVQLV